MEIDLLSKQDVKTMEKRIKDFDVGTGLGRLPHKISANYGSYTASQWKNWTLFYSLFVLDGLLPEEHMRCWQAFVLAFLTVVESDSNSDCSCDTDDSEYNFIPGHVNIDDIEVEDDGNFSLGVEQAEPDPDNYKPYEDEPIATEGWLSEYQKKARDSSSNESSSIFTKGNISEIHGDEEYLQNPNEFQCCVEIEECVECLSSEMVITEVGTKPNCVTQHASFGQVCLQKWSLQLAADKYKTRNKTKFLRGISYRDFTRLVCGYLGGRRIPLPACTYHKIRATFPDEKSSI
ncbi:hypothetical protein P5673_026500 [Acropora cervicornis]|uniref:Uncharacterized protein n=1 Tax=Acropora cervicornis TaxID=6130 RepID=A0AAD9Q0K3_ACRCE|nr:hypothetical protein P5673_026500 [Acropora cervicornis]